MKNISIKEMRELVKKGYTQKDMTKHFNTTDVALRKIYQDAGYDKFKHFKNDTLLPNEIIVYIMDMIEEGCKPEEICKKLGINNKILLEELEVEGYHSWKEAKADLYTDKQDHLLFLKLKKMSTPKTSVNDICKELKLSQSTIFKLLRKYQLSWFDIKNNKRMVE